MNSPICKMFGIDFPLVAFSHCRDVVVAVSKAGGFGVFGASMISPEQLNIELDWIDAHVDGKPYGLDIAVPENIENKDAENQTAAVLSAQIPEHYHVFVENLLKAHNINTATPVPADEDHTVSAFHDVARRLVEEGLRHPIRLFVNALGLAPDYMIERSHAKGVYVGALVGAKEHAVRQVQAGVDVIVAQGTEAAAHCGEVSTMVLVPEVVAALKAVKDVPVLAAGGIVTGRQMAGAMAMGAAGVWTGSVWLPTTESNVSTAVRDKIIASRSRDTIRSRAMTGKPARQLRSAWNSAWESKESPGTLPTPFQYVLTEHALQLVDKSIEGGNEAARPLVTEGAGQGIGLIDSVKSAKTVVQEFREDFADAIERLMTLVE